MIKGKRWLIATEILECEEAAEDGSVDNYVSDLDEEDDSGLVEVGLITGIIEAGTKEVEEVHQAVKFSSLFSYIMKPTSLLTQRSKENNKAQEKLFNDMCNFGAQAVWRNGRRAVSYYLDVDTITYQYRLLNLTPLD